MMTGSLETASTIPIQPPVGQPLRRAVRRLRWFKSTFEAQLRSLSAETGIAYRLDAPGLTRCFLHWLQAFEAQKPGQADERQAYIGFAAGLMLRQLLIDRPVSAERMPETADPGLPAHFWPEGYAYVMYSLTIRQAVIREECHHDIDFSPLLAEIRTWWSFRENVRDDPSAAMGFLDLFAGDEPDWSMPAIFKGDIARRGAVGLRRHDLIDAAGVTVDG